MLSSEHLVWMCMTWATMWRAWGRALQTHLPHLSYLSEGEWKSPVGKQPIIPLAHWGNWPYRKYAIWPRDGACHANHACAALTVSRSCRQAFVFFHWKCTQVLQKSSSLSIKQTCLKRYHHDLLRHLVAFSKFDWFMSCDPKIMNFSTHFVHKP